MFVMHQGLLWKTGFTEIFDIGGHGRGSETCFSWDVLLVLHNYACYLDLLDPPFSSCTTPPFRDPPHTDPESDPPAYISESIRELLRYEQLLIDALFYHSSPRCVSSHCGVVKCFPITTSAWSIIMMILSSLYVWWPNIFQTQRFFMRFISVRGGRLWGYATTAIQSGWVR